MIKTERIAIWGSIGFLALWLLVATVVIVGELRNIEAFLAGEVGSSDDGVGNAGPWESDEAGDLPGDPPSSGGPEVGIAGVTVLTDALAMTVTVRSSGAGDLLYEPPVIVDEDDRTYTVFADSLEDARFAFLDLVTRGQAQTTLVFSGAPVDGARLKLILNPGQQEGDVLAPRMEVPVPVMVMPPTPTPLPEEPSDG